MDLSKIVKEIYQYIAVHRYDIDRGWELRFIVGILNSECSDPIELDLPLEQYKKIIVQINRKNIFTGNRLLFPNKDKCDNYKKYILPNFVYNTTYLMPFFEAEKFFDIVTGTSNSQKEINLIPLPCNKCKLEDKWNSIGKDGNWYCYNHCSY